MCCLYWPKMATFAVKRRLDVFSLRKYQNYTNVTTFFIILCYCLSFLHILFSCSTATKVTPLTMKALLDIRLNPRKNTEIPSLTSRRDINPIQPSTFWTF